MAPGCCTQPKRLTDAALLALVSSTTAFLFSLFDQRVERVIKHLLARGALPILANDALVIDQKESWKGLDLPLLANRSASGAVLPAPPVDLVLLHVGLEGGDAIPVGVDAEQGEGLLGELRHERPLLGKHPHAGPSPESPEVDKNNFSAIVAELELLVGGVLAFNVGGGVADQDAYAAIAATGVGAVSAAGRDARFVGRLRFIEHVADIGGHARGLAAGRRLLSGLSGGGLLSAAAHHAFHHFLHGVAGRLIALIGSAVRRSGIQAGGRSAGTGRLGGP